MTGSFTTSRQVTVGRQSPQNIYRYDYKVRWEICRGAFYCSS
jgi:hypothetical protein